MSLPRNRYATLEKHILVWSYPAGAMERQITTCQKCRALQQSSPYSSLCCCRWDGFPWATGSKTRLCKEPSANLVQYPCLKNWHDLESWLPCTITSSSQQFALNARNFLSSNCRNSTCCSSDSVHESTCTCRPYRLSIWTGVWVKDLRNWNRWTANTFSPPSSPIGLLLSHRYSN